MKLLRTLALAAFLPGAALAGAPMETVQIVNGTGTPLGTPENPLNVTGGGSGGGGGTVTQGPAATDTAGNRWPVVAYQGGAWTFGLSGPIPAGSNVIGGVTQSGIWNVTLSAGSNVVGSTTLRSAGTNRSASVTTTAANLMAANASRQGWKVKNDCSVAVWINFDATATATAGSGNIQVPAGAYMASEPGFVETGAMSAIAASGTCALTAREH